MGRRIPIIKINPGQVDYDNLLEIPELKERIIGEVIIAIKEAVKNNKKKASIVEIGGTGYYIEIEKNQFKPSLENALKHFVKKEEYDKCIECRDLIKVLE
jgi:protein-arginine kinase activator protein McsA